MLQDAEQSVSAMGLLAISIVGRFAQRADMVEVVLGREKWFYPTHSIGAIALEPG